MIFLSVAFVSEKPLLMFDRIIPQELTLDFLNQRKKGIKES